MPVETWIVMLAQVTAPAATGSPGSVGQAAPNATNIFGGSSPLLLVILLGVLSIVPFVLLVGTSFVKVSIVLGIVRNAIGTQNIPSNMVVTGLAAILTLHIMAPTGAAIASAAGPLFQRALVTDAAQASRPGSGGADATNALARAWNAAKEPIRHFLRANSTQRDRVLFLDLARRARARSTQPVRVDPPAENDLSVLLPAFVVSELTRAFVIAFLVLLPFLVVDLVIANLLTALGLQMVSPTTIALPFKLLLFVLADGWYLLSRALVLGYR